MNKIKIIAFFCLCSFVINSQNKYEAFQYEDKFGVVEISTLNEFIEPIYSGRDIYFDAITLINGTQYTFVDRMTGNAENYTASNQELRFSGHYYRLFYKDGKSIFISKNTKNKHSFDKKYQEAVGNGSDLIVRCDGLYEVYEKPNFKTPKVKDIKASKVYKDLVFRKKTQKEEYLTIFYGEDDIYVFDKKFTLLKKYPVKTEFESRMFDTIANEFTKVEKESFDGFSVAPIYFTESFKDGYTTLISKEFKKTFRIKGNYRNHIIYGKYDWIILTDKETSKRYSFRIDFENKRFMLPKKYQEVLDINFVE